MEFYEKSVDENNNKNRVINHFWQPNQLIIEKIKNYCLKYNYTKILEIGPGIVPFELSTDFIGCNEKTTNYVSIDIDKDMFPYSNNNFDFVYCRHVLEDIQNPDFALNEISRVSKYGGYVETPSPLIEVSKNVDFSQFSKFYCGYIHHRYIVWSNIQKNEIYFLPKYSCILDHILNFHTSETYNLINNFPIYWNNYFIFKKNPSVIMYKNGVNFNVNGTSVDSMIEEYIALVSRAINESIENTNYFFGKYIGTN